MWDVGCGDMNVIWHPISPPAHFHTPPQVLFFDALHLHPFSTLKARKSALFLLAISSCGLLIASASAMGTVVNVHFFPQGELLHALPQGGSRETKLQAPPDRHLLFFLLLCCKLFVIYSYAS
jgi:hypothetical protein